MSHDIEADYKEEYGNEDQQCRGCKLWQNGYCSELEQTTPPAAHCDFFSSRD